MKLLLTFLLLLGIQQVSLAQNLKKMYFNRVEDAPQMIEREKAVIYIRSVIPDIFINSTNPDYQFRKVEGKPGEWIVRINPSQAYMISVGANGYLATLPQRIVLKLHEVQVWEVTGEAPVSEKIPVNFLVEPVGALISINGEEPKVLQNQLLPIGTHQIEISKPGFESIREEIAVSKEKNLFQYKLKQAQLIGISIQTEPSGATVFMDGVEMMQKTTFQEFKLSGSYKIRLELTGFVPHEETLVLNSESMQVNRNITLIRNVGTVEFAITPTDAQIVLNGQTLNTPKTEISPGKYAYRISKAGFATVLDSLTVELGKTTTKSVTLEQSTGRLIWTLNPDSAKILINKQDFSGKSWADLLPGLYQIEISAPGFETLSEAVSIEKQQRLTKNWKLTALTGGIRFISTPSVAEAVLVQKGKELKRWKGLNVLTDIPIGDYEIIVSAKGFKSERIPVKIEKQLDADIKVELKPLAKGEKEEQLLAIKSEKSSGFPATFKSILFPGWGVSQVTNGRKSGTLTAVSTLSLLAGGVIVLRNANNLYDDYLAETNPDNIDAAYTTANNRRQLALSLLGAGAAIWVWDVLWVATHKEKEPALAQTKTSQKGLSLHINPFTQSAGVRYGFGK